jgi:hypothetical protein
MAVTHIGCNETTNYGRLLKSYMLNFEASTDGLIDLLSAMALMLNGDGTQDAHYTYMTAQFGYANDALSHQAYTELNSLVAHYNTDASTTGTKSAMAQAFSKFR